MNKRLLLLTLCCVLLFPIAVHAVEAAEASAPDWTISVLPKPTKEELERQRWSYVFVNDIGRYAFDNTSLHVAETDKQLIHVLVKTIFTDPKVIVHLNEQYKAKLNSGDKVASSEMQLVFQIKQKKYAVTEIKVLSEQGRVLEDSKQRATFIPVTPKTFTDSMYEIAKKYEREN